MISTRRSLCVQPNVSVVNEPLHVDGKIISSQLDFGSLSRPNDRRIDVTQPRSFLALCCWCLNRQCKQRKHHGNMTLSAVLGHVLDSPITVHNVAVSLRETSLDLPYSMQQIRGSGTTVA